MSLYGFGKLVCPQARCAAVKARLTASAVQGGFAVAWDAVDRDDRLTLDDVSALSGEGIYFALYSSADETDATQLWIDAMTSPSDSTLCRAVSVLANDPDVAAGGLALVDGSIDEVFPLAPEQVVDAVLEDSRVPWDQGPNRLYVWQHQSEPS